MCKIWSILSKMSNLDSFWHFYTFFCTFCYTSVGVEGLEELPPSNTVFWQDMSAWWEVYLRKPSVCLLSKLHETSASNAVNVQIKGRNQTITWQSETAWLLLHNSFPFCSARFPGCDTASWLSRGGLNKLVCTVSQNLASKPSIYPFTQGENNC